jgi:hypothetical protein
LRTASGQMRAGMSSRRRTVTPAGVCGFVYDVVAALVIADRH